MAAPTPARADRARLHAALDAVVLRMDVDDRLANDPVGVVRAYPREERELVAHIASALAYGAVQPIRRAIREVLSVLGEHPTAWVRDAKPGDFTRARPDFVYRMTRAEDVDAFLVGLGGLLREHATLEDAFLLDWQPDAPDLVDALGAYVARLRTHANSTRRGFRYLTPDPALGGATKRWHLMLRWLVRPDDGVDLGLWTRVPTRQLLLPIDRHIGGIVRNLGWVARSSEDLRFTRTATAELRRFDPDDPLRYDFALCHLGISRGCLHRWEATVCPTCPLVDHCVSARR